MQLSPVFLKSSKHLVRCEVDLIHNFSVTREYGISDACGLRVAPGCLVYAFGVAGPIRRCRKTSNGPFILVLVEV